MAFLCPVRIRSNGGGARKKKQQVVDGTGTNNNHKKQRSFLSATVSSIIHGDDGGDGGSPGVANVSQGPGRITGSSSIETLVRVGLEKEAGIPPEARNMVVLHDFTPCVDDELEVRRGSVVSILYRENDWVYVILEQLPNGGIGEDGSREGFIPHSYCAPYGSPLAEMALSGGVANKSGGRREEHGNQGRGGGRAFEERRASSTVPFYKDPSPTRYIALYKFTARDENDVNVERGELLTVLNKDDPDWFYVVRSDGQEGFVPSAFVYPLAQQQQNSNQLQQPTYQQIHDDELVYGSAEHHANHANHNVQPHSPGVTQTHSVTTTTSGEGLSDVNPSSPPPSTSPGGGAQQYGTELVMLYDYKAQAPDDLSVRRGDWIYADLLHQTVEGWLWAFAPKQRKYGFIPKAYARPPAMTSL